MMEYKRMRMHPGFNIALPDIAVAIDVDNIIYWSDAFNDEEAFRSFMAGFEKLFGYGGLMTSDPAITMYAPYQENAEFLFVIDIDGLRGPDGGLTEKIRQGAVPIDLNKLGSLGYGFPSDPYDVLMLVFDLAASVRNVVFEEDGEAWWEEQVMEIVSHDAYRIVVGVNQAWLVDIGAIEKPEEEQAEEGQERHRRTQVKH
jgi:hypothetical protein